MFKLLAEIFGQKSKKSHPKIRKIYFGIRIRLLGLLFVVMVFIISFFTLMLYLNQRNTLYEEKKINADKLIKILSVQAREYLDRDVNTTRDEIKTKYQAIDGESNNFLKYNEFIEKIMLVDKYYTVHFSTYKNDQYKNYKFPYFVKCLEQKEERTNFYPFEIKTQKKTEHYIAITFPVELHEGDIINIIEDFNKYYDAYYKAKKTNQIKYYRILSQKYKNLLIEEPQKKPLKKNSAPVVSKEMDIDYLFLKLFSNLIKDRRWNIRRGENWLWEDKWLTELKTKKFNNINNEEIKSINDLIIERMNYLFSQVEELKNLGALAILYDYDKMTKDLDRNLNRIFYAALGFLLFSIVVFLIVINIIIKNLKILEKWAVKISEGDFNSKIKIETNDEIGRLSDVFNNMINELKIKFHLEKFVSRSTKNMIDKKSERNSLIQTGATDRKNLSFIFSDVRGFTSFTEKNDPELVIEILNMYFEAQAKIIKSKKGDIDDYVGDQIMAHFSGEKQKDTAITAAVEIMREIQKMNEERRKKSQPFFEVGIGVHCGEVVTGNIGASEFRMDFACLGDAVNLTSRLCSAAEPGEILASKEIFKKTSKKFKTKKHDPVTAKGKTEKIEVVDIIY